MTDIIATEKLMLDNFEIECVHHVKIWCEMGRNITSVLWGCLIVSSNIVHTKKYTQYKIRPHAQNWS